jgi:hypothetical protein
MPTRHSIIASLLCATLLSGAPLQSQVIPRSADSLPSKIITDDVVQVDPLGRRDAQDSILLALAQRSPDAAAQDAITRWQYLSETSQGRAVRWIAGPDGAGLARLVPLLSASASSTLFTISYELGRQAEVTPAAVDSLTRMLFRSANPKLRVLAVTVAAGRFQRRPVTLDGRILLEVGVADPSDEVRRAAYDGIGTAVHKDTSTRSWGTAILARGLDDRDEDVRVVVIYGLTENRIRLRNGARRLREMGRTGSDQTRMAAIRGLANYWDETGAVSADLQGYLTDTDWMIVESALESLSAVAELGGRFPSEVVAAVRAAGAREENPYFRLDAIRTLAAMLDTSGLASLVADPDTIVAARAVRELARFSSTHRAVVGALDDPRDEVVHAAILGLVPLLFQDSMAVHPRTPRGLAARDTALKMANVLRASRLVGKCFKVEVGTFSPPIAREEDSVYFRPPRAIAFLAEPSDFPSYEDYLATIALANGAVPTVGIGSWTWNAGVDSLDAVWSTGFSGLGISAGRDGALLRGTISTFTDVIGGPRFEASVTLLPVTCTSIRRDH